MTPAIERNVCYVFASLLFILVPTFALATPFNWQGSYIGAYTGGTFANNKFSTNTGSVTSSSYFATSADINAINTAGSFSKNPSTAIIGLQAGHDWVWQEMIYGIAFDYSALPLHSSHTVNNTYPDNPDQYSVHTSMQTNWLFTLRGRLGYQPPPLATLPSFIYFTGGMAMTQLKVNNSFSDNSAFLGSGGSHTAQNQIGWTMGAGFEVAVYNHVSVDLQYLYVQVPSVKTMAAISNADGGFGILPQSLTSPFSTNVDFHTNLLQIGLNYRFDE